MKHCKTSVNLKRLLSFLILFLLNLTFVNPITTNASSLSTSRISVHDPSIVKSNGKYYIFGTHLSNGVSSNLTLWDSITTNVNTDYETIFSESSKWSSKGSSSYELKNNLWAPDIIYNTTMKKWCMYMSVNGDNFYSSIALATSDNIDGPYTYSGSIVYSGFTNNSEANSTDYPKVMGTDSVNSRYISNGKWNSSYGPNAIDPCVLYDKNGDLWMSYGSWFGGIFILKLDKETGLRDYSTTYSTTTNVSDQYFGIKISGGYGGTGEGSYIVWDEESGYYYLYESYCGLDATDDFSGYHIRLFRSKNITGPYVDANGNNAICTNSNYDQSIKGIKPFGNYSLSSLNSVSNSELSKSGYMSGGHNSAFIDDDGSRYLIYHTRFNTGDESHQVRVHQQFLNEDGWPVTAVYEYLGSSISKTGYSSNDIVGTYDFINHGLNATTAFTNMLPTFKVSLNSDGTITGDYTGTWTEKSGSYQCTMVVDGVTYKGVFFKQYDESSSHKETMTFSLIGENNKSIWGSKTSNSTISSSEVLDGIYYIKNIASGLYLDITNGSTTDGTNVQQWELNGSDAQKFKLVSDGNGYYSVLTGTSNYQSSLDVLNGNTSNGTNIEQWKYWGGDMQKFKVIEVSSGKYVFFTKSSNNESCMDLYNTSSELGANINQWAYWGGNGQLWSLESTTTNLDGTYLLQNVASGLYLDVTDDLATDGANIRQWDLNNSHAQTFKLVSDGSGYYSILTASSNYTSCLDVVNGNIDNGTNIEQWTYWGGDMQKFKLIEVANGEYAFLTKSSNNKSCIDLYESSSSPGANINQWEYWGGSGQHWRLIKK